MTLWQKILRGLGISPLNDTSNLSQRLDDEMALFNERLDHITLRQAILRKALLTQATELSVEKHDAVKKLLHRPAFQAEIDATPIFPYGNDSRSPR